MVHRHNAFFQRVFRWYHEESSVAEEYGDLYERVRALIKRDWDPQTSDVTEEEYRAIWREIESTGPRGLEEKAPVYLGDGRLEMPDGTPLRLTSSEHAVLEGLIDRGACTKSELERSSGNREAVAILKTMRRKYGLERWIRLPVVRFSGGYGTKIVDGRRT
jgi:hypothetical protein